MFSIRSPTPRETGPPGSAAWYTGTLAPTWILRVNAVPTSNAGTSNSVKPGIFQYPTEKLMNPAPGVMTEASSSHDPKLRTPAPSC